MVNIEKILSFLKKYFPLETDETLSERIGVKIEVFSNYKKNNMSPKVEIKKLIKSFFETDYFSFVNLLEENTSIRALLSLSKNDWSWLKNKFKNTPPVEGSTFDNVYAIRQIETDARYLSRNSSKSNDTLFDEENIEYDF
jgi:hypothetical protein